MLLANHGAPLHDPQTATLIESAIVGCQFILGFQALHDLDPTEIGDCIDNQAYSANGDAVQHTTKGLLVWRKADNWTAFTNGSHTWISGPQDLVSRPNSERYSWEANPDGLPVADGGDTMPPVPARFAGGGYHHGLELGIAADGTGGIDARAWVNCGPGVEGPCDQGGTWGIHASLKFDHVGGDTLYGTVLTSKDPKSIPLGPIKVVVQPFGQFDVLFGDAQPAPTDGHLCGGPYWAHRPVFDPTTGTVDQHWDCGA